MANSGPGRSVLRGLGRIARFLGKCVAVLLACCLGLGALAACVTASILAADLVSERGGNFYEELRDRAVSAIRSVVNASGNSLTEAQKWAYLTESLQEMSAAQAETDAQLLAELNSGAYGPDAPFVLVNPYGYAPMSALVMFQTEEPMRASVRVEGDTALAEVAHEFSTYATDHMIPVYGLYAGRRNAVTVTLEARGGAEMEIPLEIETDPLPDALAHETVRAELIDAENYAPGFTFTYQGNNSQASRAAIDVNGDYRWYLDTAQQGSLLTLAGYCGSYNDGNSIFLSCGSLYCGPAAVLELNYLGKLLNAWLVPYGVHHDIVPDGDSILITGSADGGARETLVYEIDAASGEIVSAVDYADVLQVYRDQTRDDPELDQFYSLDDWCHINAVLPCDGAWIVSSRHQSTVLCGDAEGNIRWMLCDPEGYYEYYQQYILTPVGEDFSWPYTQHAPQILPDQDGDPDTLDILLFDNGDFREEAAARSSRMVQYRINAREMTVEQVWSYGEGRTEIYSYRHGDANLLENGNRLGSFEPYDDKFGVRCAYAIEVTEAGDAVWECWRTSDDGDHEYSEYRLERLEIYGDAAEDLHIGEAARLFLPD